MKVLAIGNSFSQDAMRYLHQIAKAEGEELLCANLYIGGCSLERHAQNIKTGEVCYEYQVNGEPTKNCSLLEGLLAEEWDVVTMQQASHYSFLYDTYQPYLTEVADFVKLHAPQAELRIHQTWAYERGSEKLQMTGYQDPFEMFRDAKQCYKTAAAELGGLMIIPSGQAMMMAVQEGIPCVYRDTFHADLGFGRFLLGCVWFTSLFGRGVSEVTQVPLEIPVDKNFIEKAKNFACQAALV